MIKRPALDDMPKDQEYTKEIDYGQKKMTEMFSGTKWTILIGTIIYLVVGYFLEIRFVHLWLIGFPIIIVLGFLERLVHLTTISAYEHSRMFEYFNKHLLYRLEKIHETIENNKGE